MEITCNGNGRQRRNNEQFNETFKTDNTTSPQMPMNWKFNEIIFVLLYGSAWRVRTCSAGCWVNLRVRPAQSAATEFSNKKSSVRCRRVNRSVRCDARSANASNASREPMFYSIRLDVGDASLVSTFVLCRAERCTYFTLCQHIRGCAALAGRMDARTVCAAAIQVRGFCDNIVRISIVVRLVASTHMDSIVPATCHAVRHQWMAFVCHAAMNEMEVLMDAHMARLRRGKKTSRIERRRIELSRMAHFWVGTKFPKMQSDCSESCSLSNKTARTCSISKLCDCVFYSYAYQLYSIYLSR